MQEIEAINLIRVEKKIIEDRMNFPKQNEAVIVNAISTFNPNHKFIIDINRKRAIMSRCTYQKRIYTSVRLLRLDVDTKPHRNPDDEKVEGTHIHIFKEGYDLAWAYPLDHPYLSEINPSFDLTCFEDTTSLIENFINFCKYCNISSIPKFQVPM
jgi:hypothetical protein